MKSITHPPGGTTAQTARGVSPEAVVRRWTQPTFFIVTFLLDLFRTDQAADVTGTEIADATHISVATAYPVLRRLERAGWLLARDEMPHENPIERGRPPRTYFRINPEFKTRIQQEVAVADARQRAKGSTRATSRTSSTSGAGPIPASP
ncbi:PadR family transcriptional regulator [Streptomyces sp. NPDC057620]|uniref:PadR family transcriptional regulator n=1 Tax=Streptomyces sp. NPDC057620 TaxID=3346185 RepID=UPI003692CF80